MRALSWHEVLAPHDREVADGLGDPVGSWLEVFDGVSDGTIRLGDA